jgi:hypothetical protein
MGLPPSEGCENKDEDEDEDEGRVEEGRGNDNKFSDSGKNT